jgi:hypothetical protein
MLKFALGVSVTVNVVLGAAIAAVAVGAHTPEGAHIINLYMKNRGYLALRD